MAAENVPDQTNGKVCVVGAGFSGAVIARELAEQKISSVVVDIRPHVAGNCHTERDPETGVLVHRYGPHIFHTDQKDVWHYIQHFGEFEHYIHRVKAASGQLVFSFPVNLHTISQFYGQHLTPAEARSLVASKRTQFEFEPVNFEQQALSMMGEDMYNAFFAGYTEKQWGINPVELPASILKRIPMRFDYNDNYYDHPYQGMPRRGYSEIVRNLLDHDRIEIQLNTDFRKILGYPWTHLFFSAPIDDYFDNCYGSLEYRTLDFEEIFHDGDRQGCAVINYCDFGVPFTRITEFNHFSPWEDHQKSISFREYSRNCRKNDIPYYPVRLAKDKRILRKYVDRANQQGGVTFVGRLGTYRYLDMDRTIAEAIDTVRKFIRCRKQSVRMPAFVHQPL